MQIAETTIKIIGLTAERIDDDRNVMLEYGHYT